MAGKRWLSYGVAYLVWIVLLLLGLWFIVISRQGFLGALSAFYVKDSLPRAWEARFYDKAYTIALGLLWLVFMIITEDYFRTGVGQGRLWRRCARVAGPELLLIFVADLFLLLVQRGAGRSWWRWLILASEIVGGVALFCFGRSSRKPARAKPD